MIELWKIKAILCSAIICHAAARGVPQCIQIRDHWRLGPLSVTVPPLGESDKMIHDLAVGLQAAIENDPSEDEKLLCAALTPLLDAIQVE